MKETKSNFLSLSLSDDTTMGKIHSIFETSFNAMLGTQLVHFGREGAPVSAHGCILKKEDMAMLLSEGQPGDLVRYKNGIITFYTREKILTVPLSSFVEVDLRIPFCPIEKEKIENSLIYAALSQIDFWKHIGLPVDDQLKEALSQLENYPQINEKELEDVLSYLVGRGGGLTPSGDDFIVGFMMAQKAFGTAEKWDKAVKVALSRRNTTDISLAYYEAALSGFVSELFCVLVRSLSWENKEDVDSLIELIKKYGHTSGTDTLFGFMNGLGSIINEMRE